MKVYFLPIFVRQFEKLDPRLQEEVLEKIELFKKDGNNAQLRTHKLHGELSRNYSFSVNYRVRIVFSYLSKKEIVLLAIGDHSVYQ